MKILIADDEILTREGLKKTIDWSRLGITEILESDDGLNALDTAKREHPDIILSDIRMPRLNGLELAHELRKILPDISIIFMSGFSDREYLKAAIRLKAVSYVEKPVNISEIEDAILEAAENNLAFHRSQQTLQRDMLAQAGRLALWMTFPPGQARDFSDSMLQDTDPSLRSDMYFVCFIVKFSAPTETIPESMRQRFLAPFDAVLSSMHMSELHVEKHDIYLVIHVYSVIKPGDTTIRRICHSLENCLEDLPHFFISVGSVVSGIENAYRSYNAAVILMQSSFFSDWDTCLFSETDVVSDPAFIPDSASSYRDILLTGDADRIHKFEDQLFNSFKNSRKLLPNQVKDIYYQMFLSIVYICRTQNLHQDSLIALNESMMEHIQGCGTLRELAELLRTKSDEYLHLIKTKEPENPVIISIRDFIHKNIARENLSVKEIGEYVHLTSTYVCTVFRNETGTTLNQYITQVRMEQAKKLLSETTLSISDISTRVGYSDGNYFGKSFKKYSGRTPSEYREKASI